MNRKNQIVLASTLLAVAAVFTFVFAGPLLAAKTTTPVTTVGGVELRDVEEQTTQFVAWDNSIELTSAQEKIRVDALSALPAPCCSDNTAATCCCPCTMAKSIWGLSKYLITEKDAGVEEVRQAAQDWITFMQPEDGFSGDVCYTGGCNRAFHENGCGGMNASKPIF